MGMAGGHAHPWNDLYKLDEPVAERIVLETAARESTVQSYFVTRAAQRTLSLITQRMESGSGDGFWLADPPRMGKTHFLNYWIALRAQLARAQDGGRELVLAFDCSQPGSAGRLESDLLAAMARELGGSERRGTPLWRRIGASAGLQIALGEARRAGVRAVSIVVDFGTNPAPAFVADLVQIARGSRHPSIVLIVAGAGVPPPDAVISRVGPADTAEQITIALARARSLDPRWSTMARLYQGIDLQPFSAAEIFPFHPETVRGLAALFQPLTIAGLARAARDVLSVHRQPDCLVYPCELFEAAQTKGIIHERLGADGRHSLHDGYGAIQRMARARRPFAEQIVRTLALAHLCGKAPALELDELAQLLPPSHAPRMDRNKTGAERLAGILPELARLSSGAIAISPAGAVFVPAHADGADLERFNRALPLLRLFDPALAPAERKSQVDQELERLDRALSNLIEEAHGVIDALDRFAVACGAGLTAEVRHTVESFIEILNGGTTGLLALDADPSGYERARSAWSAYRELAAAAAFVPALFTMKEYLERTRLEPEKLDSRKAPEIAGLAAEKRLLEAELGAQAPYSKARESMAARFEKFKWTYLEVYRTAHDQWRLEMQKGSMLLREMNCLLEALLKLDSIPALGPPRGAQFQEPSRQAGKSIPVCGLEEPFSAQAVPICPACGYVLGATPPTPELLQLLDRVRRALSEKLTMLSRGAIARLIKKYDHAHRLEGFLKIIQAAQTEALAAVLDDQLTAYIARLLEHPDTAAQSNRKTSR
jgi:hypothetical protein